jgi:hypothetical protein
VLIGIAAIALAAAVAIVVRRRRQSKGRSQTAGDPTGPPDQPPAADSPIDDTPPRFGA